MTYNKQNKAQKEMIKIMYGEETFSVIFKYCNKGFYLEVGALKPEIDQTTNKQQ